MGQQSAETQLALLKDQVLRLEQTVNKLEDILSNQYLTRQEAKPLFSLVYGGTGLMLTGILYALLNLIGLRVGGGIPK